MVGNRILNFMAVGLILVGCTRQPTSQTRFSYEKQIGLAHISYEKSEGCFAIANPSIKEGVKVTLVDQAAENLLIDDISSVNEATVVEHLSQDCDNDYMFSTELSVSGPTYYRIRTAREWKGNGYVVAIVDPSEPVTVRDRIAEGDLDADGTKESFRVCTSNEGVHYQVWTGEPLTGRPRWHWYVYAGYDTEPSCTEKEYFGPK